jgi:hypothetical protein
MLGLSLCFASGDATIGSGPSAEFGVFIGQQQRLWKDIVLRARIRSD